MASEPAGTTPKRSALKLIERLDDDVSFEDIIYQLYVLEKIQKGLEDTEAGRVVSHEEVRERLGRWLK